MSCFNKVDGLKVTLAQVVLHFVNFAKFSGELFCRKYLGNYFRHGVVYLFSPYINKASSLKVFIWCNAALGKEIYQPAQFCTAMEIKVELRLPNAYYDSLKEKEEALSSLFY